MRIGTQVGLCRATLFAALGWSALPARHWARDAAVIAAQDRICDDEMSHAALGYRFVKWALDASPAPVRAALTDMLGEELDALRREDAPTPRRRESFASLL